MAGGRNVRGRAGGPAVGMAPPRGGQAYANLPMAQASQVRVWHHFFGKTNIEQLACSQ